MGIRRFVKIGTTPLGEHKVYDFKGGTNTSAANEVLTDQLSPYLRNARYKSRETIKTRQGIGYYSDPVGETSVASQNLAVTVSVPITAANRCGVKFTAGSTAPCTRTELQISNGGFTPTGNVLVEIWSNSGGSPSAMLARTSILSTAIDGTYSSKVARFHSPAQLVSGTTYWIVAYVESNGVGSYSLGAVNTATSTKSSLDEGVSWMNIYNHDINFNVYQSTNKPVIGDPVRFVQSTGTKKTIFATSAGVYAVNDGTGAVSLLWSGSASATNYVFEQVNDTLFWANGVDTPQQYNGTTVSSLSGWTAGAASYVKLHKNTLFWVIAAEGNVKIVYSQPGDFASYTSVSFLYVPSPKNPDPIQRLESLGDVLIIHTKLTKWYLNGSDITSFTLRRSLGLQGVANPLAGATRDNLYYFASDSGIYSHNGSTDTLISEPIQPDYDAITDKDLISCVISGNYLYVFYPTAGSSYNNSCFVFDLVYGGIFIDNNTPYASGINIRGVGEQERVVFASSISGQLFYGNQGYSDMGCPIAFEYWTKYETFKEPAAKKQIRRFYPEFTGQAGYYSCAIYVDYDFANAPTLLSEVAQQQAGDTWGITFTWGSSVWGSHGTIKPRIPLSGSFKARQYRYSHTGVDQPVEIVGYSEFYIIKRPR